MRDKPALGNAWHIYCRLFGYVRRYGHYLLLALLASMLYSGIDAWFASFIKPLVNRGLVGKDHDFLQRVPWLVMAVFMLRGVASFVSNYNISSVSRTVILKLREDIFRHLQRLPAHYYDNASSGGILSLILFSVEQVANASADVLTTAVQATCLIIGLLVVMFYTSWKLSLLYFIIMPVILVIMRYTSQRVRRLSLSIQTTMAHLTHIAEENIEGYREVRSFGGETYEMARFSKALRVNRQREMKVVAARSISTSSVQLAAALALAITLFIAAHDIYHSILSPGSFLVLIATMLMLLKPLKDLTSMQNRLYRGIAGAQSVFEMLDIPPEEDSGTQVLAHARGELELRHVTFAYTPERNVLHDISFHVQPGEVVAFVGHSGGGKSTLISLLPRFYNDYFGDILLDGKSVREYRLQDLRHQFAVVSQSITLFNDTIANNIAYGQFATATPETIRAAAKAAYLLDFIETLPQGFDTLVGEDGVLLSGGQRQRLAIARAILKNAPILILDEATSALDTESERYIQAALDTFMRNRTTLVIAHRLSTVEHANRIIVMEKGHIIESGSHAELLAKEGAYAKLYRLQFRDARTT